MNLDTSKFEHKRVTVEQWPDGSNISQEQYRENPIAPWIHGDFEVYCGTCQDQVQEHAFILDARILHLEHALMHTQQELMRIANLIRRPAGFRAP
jgi:hypothetical protein